MKKYLALLQRSRLAPLLASQLIARTPFGMLPVAVVLLCQEVFDSFAVGGVAAGALAAGQALSGPLGTRWMSRWGARPVIASMGMVCALALALLSTGVASVPAFVGAAFLAGASTPPVQPAARLAYQAELDSRDLRLMFALHAATQESLWITGPALAVTLTSAFGARWAALTATALFAIGCLWFLALAPVARIARAADGADLRLVLRHHAVLGGGVVAFLLMAVGAATELGLIARFERTPWITGILLALFAAGSFVGGLVFGHRSESRRMTQLFFALLVGGLLIATFELSPVLTAAALVVAGLGVAPMLARLFLAVAESVPRVAIAEAYGWMGTALLLGTAAGAAAAGPLVQAWGAGAGIWLGVAIAATAAALAWALPAQRPEPMH